MSNTATGIDHHALDKIVVRSQSFGASEGKKLMIGVFIVVFFILLFFPIPASKVRIHNNAGAGLFSLLLMCLPFLGGLAVSRLVLWYYTTKKWRAFISTFDDHWLPKKRNYTGINRLLDLV